MSKKKNLKSSIDDLEMEFIEEKMKKDSALNYLTSEGLKTCLKDFGYKIEIKCKNERQKEFLNSLKDDDKDICFGVGAAGTGKSFISLAYSLKALKEGKYEHIIMVVPTAQASGKDMGFGYLKGTLDEKSQPFKDVDRYTVEKILKMSGNLEAKFYASRLIEGGAIQYEFINFMLGKTFDHSLILVNEAEQYTKDDMRLILTRLGEGSKLIITGDSAQINRNSLLKSKEVCGLTFAAEKLSDMEETAITEFKKEDIVRNPLISKILERFEN